MRLLAFCIIFLSFGAWANAQTWTNGNIVTHLGVGAGGNDIAAFNVDPLTTTFGLQSSLSASGIGPASLADDYIPLSNQPVTGIRIPWYISNQPSATLSTVWIRIFEGSPMDGGILLYDNADPSTIITSGPYINLSTGKNVYRTSGSTGAAAAGSTRRLQSTMVAIEPPLSLIAGVQYFFSWSFDSPDGTSVFTPSLGRRGNGQQELLRSGVLTWGDALGTATNQNSDVDLPFELFLGDSSTSPYNIFPEAAETIQGIDLNGAIQDLAVSDDRKMLWISDPSSQTCEVEFRSTTMDFSMRECRFGVEVGAGRPGLSVEVMLWDFMNSVWQIWGFAAPPSDTQLQARVFQNTNNLIGPNRLVRSRVRWQPINDDDPSQDGWFLAVDWCRWRITR